MSLPMSTRATIVTACSVLAFAAGCGKEEAKVPPQRPPIEVTVVAVTARDTPVTFAFVGQMQSSREVEIRARTRPVGDNVCRLPRLLCQSTRLASLDVGRGGVAASRKPVNGVTVCGTSKADA